MSLASIEGAIYDLQRHNWGAGGVGGDLSVAANHQASAEAAAAEAAGAELRAELTLAHSKRRDAEAAAAAAAAETERLRTLLSKEEAARRTAEALVRRIEADAVVQQQQHRESLDAAVASAGARASVATPQSPWTPADGRRADAELTLLGSELVEREQELSAADAVYAQLETELRVESKRQVRAATAGATAAVAAAERELRQVRAAEAEAFRVAELAEASRVDAEQRLASAEHDVGVQQLAASAANERAEAAEAARAEIERRLDAAEEAAAAATGRAEVAEAALAAATAGAGATHLAEANEAEARVAEARVSSAAAAPNEPVANETAANEEAAAARVRSLEEQLETTRLTLDAVRMAAMETSAAQEVETKQLQEEVERLREVAAVARQVRIRRGRQPGRMHPPPSPLGQRAPTDVPPSGPAALLLSFSDLLLGPGPPLRLHPAGWALHVTRPLPACSSHSRPHASLKTLGLTRLGLSWPELA